MSRDESVHRGLSRRFPRVSGDEPGVGRHASDLYDSFPRVSGDEPVIYKTVSDKDMFSPRERG